jgi:hypothetical protein
MSYNLRHGNHNHLLAAVIDDDAAGKIIQSGCGHWEEKNLSIDGRVMCYVADVEGSLTSGRRLFGGEPEAKIYFWKGSYIYKAR